MTRLDLEANPKAKVMLTAMAMASVANFWLAIRALESFRGPFGMSSFYRSFQRILL